MGTSASESAAEGRDPVVRPGSGLSSRVVSVSPTDAAALECAQDDDVAGTLRGLIDEAYRVFNMGFGFLLVIEASACAATLDALRRAGEDARQVGHIVEGDGVRLV